VEARERTWQQRLGPRIAAIVFSSVFALGVALIGVQTALHWRELGADPFSTRSEETRVVKTDATGAVSTEVTTKPADGSLVERALASGGLLFIRVALVAVGAFVAGGIAQRVLRADYAIKLGAFELPESVEEAGHKATEAINALSERVDTLSGLNAQVADASEGMASLTSELVRINNEIEDLRNRLRAQRPSRPPS
jgi:uncharacterized coiled-coil protein SlyX